MTLDSMNRVIAIVVVCAGVGIMVGGTCAKWGYGAVVLIEEDNGKPPVYMERDDALTEKNQRNDSQDFKFKKQNRVKEYNYDFFPDGNQIKPDPQKGWMEHQNYGGEND